MNKREMLAWALLVGLILASGINICEQPFCASVSSLTKTIWNDLLEKAALMSALAASVGVLVAVYFHGKNLRATQLSNSAKMVLDAFEHFSSLEMRKHRKVFSAKLKANQSAVNLAEETLVLGFLEDIGHQTRRGIFDDEMIWNSFGWWVSGYYLAVTRPSDRIKAYRDSSKRVDLYTEVEWLHNHCIVPWRKRRELGSSFSDENLKDFLDAELSLADA